MTTASNAHLSGRGYWRSLQELAQSEEFQRHLDTEFPGGIEPPASGFTRRRFLQIMAASTAMASLAGCRWPEETIVPFAKRPQGFTPGQGQQFATALEIGGVGAALLATSFDGRPVKVDGNPDHPWSLGAANAQTQASVLDMWDVDRSRTPVRRERGQAVKVTWDDVAAFMGAHFATYKDNGGRGLAFLAEANASPSRRRLREQIAAAMPEARWYQHDPVSGAARIEGARRAFGRPLRDVPHLEHARVIADFDADLAHSHPAALRNARMMARGRRPEGEMNRIYAVETTVTQTGVLADHRVPVARTLVPGVLAALAVEIFGNHGVAIPAGAGFSLGDLKKIAHAGHGDDVIKALADDLAHHRGHGLVAVGDRQPAGAHHLAHVLNAALGNLGHTVTFVPVATPDADLKQLTADAGRITTLVILDGNPLATAPADVDASGALGRIGTVIGLSTHEDATAAACTWHLPKSHYLESWGDTTAADGSVLAVQPLIEPLYATRSAIEVLAMVLGDPAPRGYDIARTTVHQLTGGAGQAPSGNPRFEERWRAYLHDGSLPGAPSVDAPGLTGASLDLPRATAPDAGNLELIITADACLYDGRFADNAWLQEMPDFATKVVWDNVASLSPATADSLGIVHGDLLELEFHGRKQLMPAYLLPGHAAGAVTVTLGYGRKDAGRVGQGVGHDAYALRGHDAPHGGAGLKVRKTGRSYPLSCTQDHHAIDPKGYQERERRIGSLVRETDLTHYREHPDFVDHQGIHHPPLLSLWDEKQYTGHKWGMSIDLNACTGCSACIVACQSENNIPVVGKEEVGRSREMHWLRLDRYFQGDPENPNIAAQPVACAHCELAPCEGVCPVAATVHTEEGLNAMVYNRCVGTRYCANNCPYKVRRFNFFNNLDELTETEKMRLNPEVSVRSRGVMEKCTYCVQRIQNAKIKAKNERRPLEDGEAVPACAQTCPTEAIVFGDLNDQHSQASARRTDKRSYDLLTYLNIKPRTSYMGRVRNPHPSLAVHADHGAGHGDGHAAPAGDGHGGGNHDHDHGHGGH